MIRKSDLTDETLDALWEVFGWSINVLLWERCQVDCAMWLRVARKLDPDPWRLGFLVLCLQIPGTQLAICAGCAVRRTQSVVSSGRLLTTVRVGVPPGGMHAAYVAELFAQGRPVPALFSVVIGLLLSCVMVDALYCMDLGITAHVEANVFMRCIKKRAWRAKLHTRRTVNDSTTRSALGSDRKERSPNSKK